MKLYNSYIKKSKSNAIEDIVIVKDGFSFSAFFFNAIWFFYQKMWKEAIIIILADFFLIGITDKINLNYADSLIVIIGFFAIIALNANHLYLNHLKRKGYQFSGYVFGKNREAAKLRFIHNLGKEGENRSIFSDSIFHLKNKKGSNKADNYFTI